MHHDADTRRRVLDRDIKGLGVVARAASYIKHQRVDAASRPVLRWRKRPLGLGVVRCIHVVVVQGHRLAAAVNDHRLTKRPIGGHFVADVRSGTVLDAIDPGLEDGQTGIHVVRVAFEIVDRTVGRETPDGTGPQGRVGAGLVHAPVVGRQRCQRLGQYEGRLRQGALVGGGGALVDVIKAGPKVQVVLDGFDARAPTQR